MPENADALSKIKHSRKNCIFCGSLPKNKTKEHILPQWLLKWTGDENRTWTYLPGLSPNGGDVAFSLNSLTFPACDLCNSEKSDFEAKAQAIIGKIDKRNAVSAEEAMLLLDWLDKIRIGLWLGYNTLSQNAAKIDPRFYINERMRSKDRILAVYPYNGTPQIGMNVFGADTPIFFYQPSCFGIKINGCLYLNISDSFIISRYIGLPFPKGKPKFNAELRAHTVGEEGYSIRQNFKDFKSVLKLHKPSILIGQSIVDIGRYSKLHHLFDSPRQKGFIFESSETRTVSKIFDFLTNQYLRTCDDLIEFGFIEIDEARRHFECIIQVFELQIRYFLNYSDGNEYSKNLVRHNRNKINQWRSTYNKCK